MMHGSGATQVDVKSLALSRFKVVFHGVSAHAAVKPEKGRSALDGLIMACQGVEFLREHVADDVKMHYTNCELWRHTGKYCSGCRGGQLLCPFLQPQLSRYGD